MINAIVKCTKLQKLTPEVYKLSFKSKKIAKLSKPGQFLNIKISDSFLPFLRRPFSIYDINGDIVSIIFNVVGEGTKVLAKKNIGSNLDVIGPCGNSFPFEKIDNNKNLFIIAGGLGVAPFPFVTRYLQNYKKIETLLGARNKSFIVKNGLKNISVATEDGSIGKKGNVLDLLKSKKFKSIISNSIIFTCGPHKMMHAIAEFAKSKNIPCFASLECDMACGIGLCQGCNMELKNGSTKYILVCKNGPILETSQIKF
ncbi:MAG: dihydroorotate dehydrogenase electron transfer subunit [Bacteroidetes bacterium]|nr:dihydroorotate dehydrogenase electron transfer subunit [Bacteroidota bacterium]